jgi:hypothetical protein
MVDITSCTSRRRCECVSIAPRAAHLEDHVSQGYSSGMGAWVIGAGMRMEARMRGRSSWREFVR